MEKKESMLVDVSKGLEEMEGARRATGISSSGRTGVLAGLSVVPDCEVPEKAVRRRFTAEYKRCILREAEACKEQGRLGALLRRAVSYTHLRAHETRHDLVCRLLLEKKKNHKTDPYLVSPHMPEKKKQKKTKQKK